MAKKIKKKDRKKQARAIGAAGGVGAFAGTLGAKVLERLLAGYATDLIQDFGGGRKKSKHDLGTRLLVALAARPRPTPLVELVARLGGDVLETADAVHKLRRARLVKYSDGRRAVQLTENGRELLGGAARLEQRGDNGSDGARAELPSPDGASEGETESRTADLGASESTDS